MARWFGPVGDCSCVCRCPDIECVAGGYSVSQISFVVNLPDELEDWSGAVDPTQFIWSGVSALNGTYVVNRGAYPTCGWVWPTISTDITLKRYSYDDAECVGESRFCPVAGTGSLITTETRTIYIGVARHEFFRFSFQHAGSTIAFMQFNKDTTSNCGVQAFVGGLAGGQRTLKDNPCDGSNTCYDNPELSITGEFFA